MKNRRTHVKRSKGRHWVLKDHAEAGVGSLESRAANG